MAAAAFFCAKACVTATLASDQAAAAEDELQQLCSTAGDSNFDISSSGIPTSQDKGVPVENVSTGADSTAPKLIVVGAGSASYSPSVPASL